MNALDSLNNSLSSFVNNDFGLSESTSYTYIDIDGNEFTDKKVTRQYKENKNYNRKYDDDTLANYDIFLIELSFEPRKNDKLISNEKTYFVEYSTRVSLNMYRIFTIEDSITVPSRNNRVEI